MAKRDRAAGVKLLGGLLRLDALQTAGFTAQELANHANVKWETARDFIRSSDFAEVVAERKPAPQISGRPANVYKLLPKGRAEITLQLAAIRQFAGQGPSTASAAAGLLEPLQLLEKLPDEPEEHSAGADEAEITRQLVTLRQIADQAPTTALDASALFEPLQLLEEMLGELEEYSSDAAEWQSRMREARMELRNAEADMLALQSRHPEHTADFARQFGFVQGRLATVERLGPPVSRLAPPPKPDVDVVGWIVEQFGAWLNGEPALRSAAAALDPLVVLLDGTVGHDPMATRMVNICRAAAVPVATFDVVRMGVAKRKQLYAGLDALRTATPLAVSDFVLTVDGRTEAGRALVTEVRELAQPGWCHARISKGGAEPGDLDLTGLDLAALRRFYVEQGARMLRVSRPPAGTVEARRAEIACRVVSALSALDAAETPGTRAHLPFAWVEQENSRWMNSAKGLLGAVVCIDAERNVEIEATLAEGEVEYIVNSESIKDNDLDIGHVVMG